MTKNAVLAHFGNSSLLKLLRYNAFKPILTSTIQYVKLCAKTVKESA